MKEKIQKLINHGITSDVLKIIAVISMLIDHIAYYFYEYIPDWLYDVMKYGVGRIAMPIFVYLVVQGFFNTKNFKKYLTRMCIFAIITQIVITVGWALNEYIFTQYITNIYMSGNILISFALTLILLKIIHEPILIKKYDKKQNIIFKVIIVVILLNAYLFIPIDYGVTVPLLGMLLYAIERFRLTVLISKSSINTNFSGIIYKSVDDLTIKKIYKALVFFAIFICILYGELYWTACFAILPIYLYNGEKKKKYNKLKYAYYIFFFAHHFVLYSLAMILSKI